MKRILPLVVLFVLVAMVPAAVAAETPVGTDFPERVPVDVLLTEIPEEELSDSILSFGGGDFTGNWTQVYAGDGWPGPDHSSVVLPDGSIVVMGGWRQTFDSWTNDVWRSTDNGTTWTLMTDNAEWKRRMGHSSVALPDGSIVLMGGWSYGYDSDVWRSMDNGATWTLMTNNPGWGGRYDHSSVALPDGSIVLMGGSTSGDNKNDVWRSTDKGATWTRMNASAGWSARYESSAVALPDGSIVLMGGREGSDEKNDVWRSTDNGVTWTQMTTGAEWSPRWDHSSVVLPDGSIMLTGGYSSGRKNDVWRSTDNGATWTQVTASAEWSPREGHSSVVLPGGSIVVIGGFDGGSANDIWRSADNGTTWSLVYQGAGWRGRYGHSSVALPDGSIVLMGGLSGGSKNDVWRSTDRGTTWTLMTASAEWSPRYRHSSVALPDGSIVLMNGYSGCNDVWRSTDNGKTWTQVTAHSGLEWGHSSVALPDGSIVLMGGYCSNEVHRSTDKGATWKQINASSGWSPRFWHSSVALPDGSIVLMGGLTSEYPNGCNDVWRSTDNGKTWTQMTASAEWPPRYGHSSVALPDGSIVLMGGRSGGSKNDVWRSTDNGATWTQVAADAGWSARHEHSSVALPDGSIILIGGEHSSNFGYLNDVWRFESSLAFSYLNALFGSDTETGTAPLTVRFTDTSTGSPTSWSWDFGDGETSTDQNPVHIYKNPGEYDVSLTVKRGSASDSITKAGLIIVNEPNAGLNIDLEYRNSILFNSMDPVEVRVRTTDSNGMPKASTITMMGTGEASVKVHATEYTYSFVPEHSGTYRVAVIAVSDDGIELSKRVTIEVIDDLSFAKKRADDLKSLANTEIDQAERMAAERSVDLAKDMFLDNLLDAEGVSSTITVFFDGASLLVTDVFRSTVGDLSGEYARYFCGYLKNQVEGKCSDMMGDAIFGDDDSYLVNSASTGIENLCKVKERRDALDQTTENFVGYIEANPDQFRDNDQVNAYINMYSSGIKSAVETHDVVHVTIWSRSFGYSYPEAYYLYDTFSKNSKIMKLALGTAIGVGAVVAVTTGVGATVVAALIPATMTIIKSVSSFDTFASVALSILLVSNVPIIADDVVHEHQNSISGIERALSGTSADFVALSVSDVSAGETASITSSGDVFIIRPSGRVETILLGGGHYTPTGSGIYKAYSYNHGNGLFSQIEGCDIAVKVPDVEVNATYTAAGDLASIRVMAENHEDSSIDDMYLTTSVSDSDGNLIHLYDEPFDLGPLQNATYEYEMDAPKLNTFYVAETILSVNYSTVLDSVSFIIETEGSNEAEKAVILSVDSPQVFLYGKDIYINLTIRSFKDALPITLEIPEFKYSTTEYITGEEVVQVVLPGQEPDDYIAPIYLYGSDGSTCDADVIRFIVQAEGTGFLSIEAGDALFPAGEIITIPLVFTDAALNNLDGEVFVQVRTPENEDIGATVTGSNGNYQFSFTPPVSGTYSAIAEAYKDGYYVYGDQVTFISGEMSPLELGVGADEENLYVNVTANGLPVNANVTMTSNGTEIAKTAVSGIAAFPKEGSYRLTAEMLFFTPTEFSHMTPEARLSLENNRTIPDRAVVFNASASHDPDGWIAEYRWDFGDGHQETTTSGYTLHPFNATGYYTVNLTVVDNDGLGSSVTRDIIVIERSTPAFDISEKSIYVNYTGDVSIQATDLDEISWLRMVIEFDPNIVEGIDVAEGDITLIPSSIANGGVIIESGAIESLSGSANLASITLKGVNEGCTTINITAVCRDVDGCLIRPIASGNTIQVLSGTPLLANFTTSNSIGTAPLAVQFTDTSIGDPTAWIWDFGDNGTSNEQHPVHTYKTAGNYTVSLTAKNADYSNTILKQDYITIKEPPAYAFVKSWGSGGSSDVESFSYPTGIATDATGNVYVADYSNHCIRVFNSTGDYVATWGSYGFWNGQFDRPTGIATDMSGNVYVSDYYNHRIQKFDSTGAFLTTWGAYGTGNGQFDKPWGIAVDTAGDIYVADYNNHRIQKFDSAGTFVTAWGSEGSGSGQFNGPICIAVDAAGYIYVSDDYNNRVQKFDSAGTFITAWGSEGTDSGQFSSLVGIAVDSAGHVFVVDHLNCRIQKFDSSGTFISTWGSKGSSDGQLNNPSDIAIDTAGNIYVADTYNNRVQKFDKSGNFMRRWESWHTGEIKFLYPAGIATDTVGDIYVADYYNHRVQKFDSSGALISMWGSYGSGNGQFDRLTGIATDMSGNVYVSDYYNHRIQKFDSTGAFLTTWGAYGTGNGQFDKPWGIAVDTAGDIYVADYNNHRIQKFDSAGTFVTAWGSEGSGSGQFNGPICIAVDAAGYIYVSDDYNNRVQKFDSAGTFITAWGSEGTDSGQFSSLVGIAVDSAGHVFVVDHLNCRIQKFDSSGTFISTWGSEGFSDGQFYRPSGIALDSAGNVYVADTYSNRIQKFSPSPTKLPVANFSANKVSGPAPLTVHFIDTSADYPSAWLWDFGDGTSSIEQNPVHTYLAYGNYTVKLTVSNIFGADSLSKEGFIFAKRVKGDFNGNGAVDIGDVARVAYMVVGKEPADLAADFNGNGAVDIGDAAKIAYYFVGKIGEL